MLELDFNKMNRIVPVVVQDHTGEVLMLGFMNREAWEKTVAEGYVTFFSRTRNQLWTKGATSGNRLKVVSATTDCDRDSLVIQVEVEGTGVVCHEGTRSCFTKKLIDNPFSPRPSKAVKRETASPIRSRFDLQESGL